MSFESLNDMDSYQKDIVEKTSRSKSVKFNNKVTVQYLPASPSESEKKLMYWSENDINIFLRNYYAEFGHLFGQKDEVGLKRIKEVYRGTAGPPQEIQSSNQHDLGSKIAKKKSVDVMTYVRKACWSIRRRIARRNARPVELDPLSVSHWNGVPLCSSELDYVSTK